MKRYFLFLLFILSALCDVMAQSVSSVDFYQDGKTVVITYDLDKTATVAICVSTDGGKTFSAPLKQVSGDVGKGVDSGKKRIVWDVLAERDKLVGDRIAFKVYVEGIHKGHKYVDLGLPSGLLWATCNIGASKPEEYGNYYAWGEIITKSQYSWSTYKYDSDYDALTKYNTSTDYGTVDNKTQLGLKDDAAHVNWRGNWRMPTDAEMIELRTNCTWLLTTINGKKGYKVVSKVNNKWIFLPAAGYRDESSLSYGGSLGCYWSSSLCSGSPDGAWYLDFDSSGFNRDFIDRSYGFSVRAVCRAGSN